MAKRTDGKTKLTPEVRQRLVEVAAEARRLVYGALAWAVKNLGLCGKRVDPGSVPQGWVSGLVGGVTGSSGRGALCAIAGRV